VDADYTTVVPNLFDAFLPLLIVELFILPLFTFHLFPVRVCRLVSTTIGIMVFIMDNNLINKSWKKAICSDVVETIALETEI